MATATQKIIIHADDQTGAAIASALRNTKKLDNQMKKSSDTMRGMSRQGRAQMAQLGHQMQDIAVQLQMGMNPMMVLGQQGSQIASVFGTGGPVIGAFIAGAAVIASVFVPELLEAKRKAGEFAEDIIKAAGGVDKLTEAQRRLAELDLKLRIQEQQRAVEQAQESIEKFKSKIESLEKAEGESGRTAKAASLALKRLGGESTTLEQALALAEAQLAATKEQMDDLTGKTREQEAAVKALSLAQKKADRDALKRMKEVFAAQDRQAKKFKRDALERLRLIMDSASAEEKFAAESKRLQKILSGPDGFMDPMETEAYRVAIEKLAASMFKPGEAAKETEKAVKSLKSAQAEHFDMIQNIGDNALRSLEDSLIGIADGSLSAKDAFKQMAASILRDMLRMQMRAGTSGLSNLFSNTLIGLGGGGDASRVTTGQGGMGPVLSGPRALGGPVSSGKAYMVGERGPELMIPSSSGRVVPNNKLGGDTINVSLNISTGVSQTVRAEIANLMPQIANATKGAVLQARQKGGSYSKGLTGI